ncbi:ABC transporter substrate-binding protein [Solwaraspora sp. WMMB335]|uniref:ABC transporter substrate-binding protein n=1 Tax=Solwaraspora sp. WMMB335 TaxID=3404118 RepID=UPI003B93DF1D
MKTRSTTATLCATALLTTLLGACGTTDPGTGATGAPAANESLDCADDTTTTSTGPVSLTDALGRTVELDQPAQRVAVLEWQQIEDVLTLCLTPVAVADVEGYRTWNTAEELPDGAADVGGRGEPNLDALFAANPDLVIIEPFGADDAVVEQLAEYDVPVLATKGADTADPIQNMLDTFSLIAEATGRQERAELVVDEFTTGLEQAKQDVVDADLATTEFIYFDGWIQGGNVTLRPFGQGSLVGELGEELGLTNAWTGEVDPVYGLGQTDIEGVQAVGAATFFHTGTVDPAGDVLAELAKNSVWDSLPAVTEGRVYAFPPGVWTFGGPRSSQQILDAYVDLLTS